VHEKKEDCCAGWHGSPCFQIEILTFKGNIRETAFSAICLAFEN